MAAFTPTRVTIDPPPDEDPLGVAVVAALKRDTSLRGAWSMPVVLGVGVATAGLGPLVVLLLRFRRYARAEKFQFEHVTEWMASRQHATPELERATQRLGAGWPLAVWAGCALAVGAFVLAIVHVVVLRRSVFDLWSLFVYLSPSATGTAFGMTVGFAYVFHMLAVNRAAANVTRFAGALGVPVAADGWAVTSSTWWCVPAAAVLVVGCFWGLPMMLAAGAQWRYMKAFSRDARTGVARRVETMTQTERAAAA